MSSKMTKSPVVAQKSQVIVPTTMDKVSRKQLLLWVNELAKANYTAIEQLYFGDFYCMLNNVLFPDSINLGAVKWNCRRESDAIENWRMLQLDWRRRAINKVIPYERLVKGKFLDNYEWLQWYKPFFELNHDSKCSFDPVAMRNGMDLPAVEKIHKPFNQSSKIVASEAPKHRVTKTGPPSTAVHSRQPATPRLYITGQEILADVDNQMTQLYAENQAMANERDLYLGKCFEVEKLCKKGANEDQEITELVASILKVLSASDPPVKEEEKENIGTSAKLVMPSVSKGTSRGVDVATKSSPLGYGEKKSAVATTKAKTPLKEEKLSNEAIDIAVKTSLPKKKEEVSSNLAVAASAKSPNNGEEKTSSNLAFAASTMSPPKKEETPSNLNVAASVKSPPKKNEEVSSNLALAASTKSPEKEGMSSNLVVAASPKSPKKEETSSNQTPADCVKSSSPTKNEEVSSNLVVAASVKSSPKLSKENVTINKPSEYGEEEQVVTITVPPTIASISPEKKKGATVDIHSPRSTGKDLEEVSAAIPLPMKEMKEPSDEAINFETKSSASKKKHKQRKKGKKGGENKEDRHDGATSASSTK